MSARSLLLAVVIAAFAVLSAFALRDVGYFGILEPHFKSWGEAQVLADLVILAVLSCIWMVRDARDSGVPAWPFVLITFVFGSFGVLFYLAARMLRATSRRPVSV